MRSDTQAVSIEAPPDRVARLVSDPENLPRWAVGFARSVRRRDGRWLVATGAGEIPVRVAADAASGTVDFWLTLAPGIEALAASRVIPRGAATEYTFTQFQHPGMPDEAFEKSVAAVRHELQALKALAEVECPL